MKYVFIDEIQNVNNFEEVVNAYRGDGDFSIFITGSNSYLLVPEAIQKITKGNPEKDTMIYQYTTAFSVSAALAQTCNTDLLYEIGKAVYDEMKEYGCTYWLAPAVNIHRNPLCGRNFEYYSEDPFLAGEMVAAMQREYGVPKQ